MNPELWGRSQAVGQEFLEWVWRETSFVLLAAKCPAYNRLALNLAKAVGFEDIGIRGESVRKKGIAYETIVLRLWRPTNLAVAS